VSPPAYQVPAAQNLPAPQKPVKIYSDAPISVIGYIGTLILYAIPLVGIIMCIVWAASSKNRNRKNLSIAVLILTIIGIILSVVLYFVAASFINGILDSYYGATGLYDLLY
jgi:asparagine N-glycosylation enzyme membrane subunit Stt3